MSRKLRPKNPVSTLEEEESIRTRAYQIYLDRSRKGWNGDAESDWFMAIRELRKTIPKDDPRER